MTGKLVAVMAHPDDAELWLGGTLALYAKTSSATVIIANKDPIRSREAEKGNRILGCNLKLVDSLSIEICTELLLELRPDIVVSHRLDDIHLDHRRTAEIAFAATTKAAIATANPKRFYMCDSYESQTISGKVQGSVIVDVTETFDLKLRALAAHKSQPVDHFSKMAERMGAMWGGRIGRPWAEAFDPLPVLGCLPSVTHL